jgi:hypothetical protein
MTLDGRDFRNCDVTDNSFVYAGGPFPLLEGAVFSRNSIQFVGAAANSLEMLRFVAASLSPEDRINLLKSNGLLLESDIVKDE